MAEASVIDTGPLIALSRAKVLGLIPAVRPFMDRLAATGTTPCFSTMRPGSELASLRLQDWPPADRSDDWSLQTGDSR
jgi:hypothetical protein